MPVNLEVVFLLQVWLMSFVNLYPLYFRLQTMGTGVPGAHGDSALAHVVEVFSLHIVTAITLHLETMAGIAQERGQSIAPVMSCRVLPMVCFPQIKVNNNVRDCGTS